MKPYLGLAFVLAPALVQCSSSSSHASSAGDGGADAVADGAEDGTSSGSGGGATDSGSSSGGDDSGSGSSGSGSGGGDGAVPTTCKTAMTPQHLSYTVSNTGQADVLTLSFDVDAVWNPETPMPTPAWQVSARGATCPFASSAQLRLGAPGADDDGGDADAGDGGITLPTTAMTWTTAGHDYPRSASDAAIWLAEYTNSPMQGSGNYWISQGGSIVGTPVGTDCYELDFANVPFAKDPGAVQNFNEATGNFLASGTARVGSGCM